MTEQRAFLAILRASGAVATIRNSAAFAFAAAKLEQMNATCLLLFTSVARVGTGIGHRFFLFFRRDTLSAHSKPPPVLPLGVGLQIERRSCVYVCANAQCAEKWHRKANGPKSDGVSNLSRAKSDQRSSDVASEAAFVVTCPEIPATIAIAPVTVSTSTNQRRSLSLICSLPLRSRQRFQTRNVPLEREEPSRLRCQHVADAAGARLPRIFKSAPTVVAGGGGQRKPRRAPFISTPRSRRVRPCREARGVGGSSSY